MNHQSQQQQIECDTCHFIFANPSRIKQGPNTTKCQSCLEQEPPPHSKQATPPPHSKRTTPPPCTPTNAGLTPSTVRAQGRARQHPPSPSPMAPHLPAWPPRSTTRDHHPPRRPYDTPPSPDLPAPVRPVPQLNRHEGQRCCNTCKTWKPELAFTRDREGAFHRGCSDCLASRRTYHQNRQLSPPAASLPASRSMNFGPISPQPNNIHQQCLTEDAINHIGKFHHALDQEALGTCDNCQESWFEMDIDAGRCRRCRSSGHLWNAANHMDPGERLHLLFYGVLMK